MVQQSGGCSASHPAPPATTPSLIPQAGGPTAALDSAAKQTNAVTLEWALTGITSSPSTPGLVTQKGWGRERSSFQAESRPPAAAVLQNTSITHRAHLSVNEARGSSQKGKWGGKQAAPRPKGRAREEARMDALVPALQSHPGPSVLAFALIFRVVHHLLQQLPVPKAVKHNDFYSWKWKNLSVSMVHSLLTGTWALSWWVPIQTSVRLYWDTIVYSQSTWRAVWVRVCLQHQWQSVAARRRRLCSDRVRGVGDSGI